MSPNWQRQSTECKEKLVDSKAKPTQQDPHHVTQEQPHTIIPNEGRWVSKQINKPAWLDCISNTQLRKMQSIHRNIFCICNSTKSYWSTAYV